MEETIQAAPATIIPFLTASTHFISYEKFKKKGGDDALLMLHEPVGCYYFRPMSEDPYSDRFLLVTRFDDRIDTVEFQYLATTRAVQPQEEIEHTLYIHSGSCDILCGPDSHKFSPFLQPATIALLYSSRLLERLIMEKLKLYIKATYSSITSVSVALHFRSPASYRQDFSMYIHSTSPVDSEEIKRCLEEKLLTDSQQIINRIKKLIDEKKYTEAKKYFSSFAVRLIDAVTQYQSTLTVTKARAELPQALKLVRNTPEEQTQFLQTILKIEETLEKYISDSSADFTEINTNMLTLYNSLYTLLKSYRQNEKAESFTKDVFETQLDGFMSFYTGLLRREQLFSVNIKNEHSTNNYSFQIAIYPIFAAIMLHDSEVCASTHSLPLVRAREIRRFLQIAGNNFHSPIIMTPDEYNSFMAQLERTFKYLLAPYQTFLIPPLSNNLPRVVPDWLGFLSPADKVYVSLNNFNYNNETYQFIAQISSGTGETAYDENDKVLYECKLDIVNNEITLLSKQNDFNSKMAHYNKVSLQQLAELVGAARFEEIKELVAVAHHAYKATFAAPSQTQVVSSDNAPHFSATK